MKTSTDPTDRVMPETAIMLKRIRDALLLQWEELLHLQRAVLKTFEPDDIHDLRVALRRFQAALVAFTPLAGIGSATELKRSVRKLIRKLGGLRNLDEALLFFRSRVPLEIAAASRLCSILQEFRNGEQARIHKALKTFDYKSHQRSVLKIALKLSAGRIKIRYKSSLTVFFSKTALKLFQPIHDLTPIATAPEQCESRHALRIAIKKWRYFLENLAQVTECDYDAVLGLLKEYQMVLGRMNDITAFGLLCRDLELSVAENAYIEEILLAEDQLLQESFIVLVEQNPLRYTFYA